MGDLFNDPAAFPISAIIFTLSIVFSCALVLIMLFVVYFLRVRAINKTKLLNNLIMRVENRLSAQQNWTDEALANLAKKINANLADLHRDRAEFNRIVRGVPELDESIGNRLLSSRKSSDFKLPKNPYDEAAFNDPNYATLHMSNELNNSEIFLKKDFLTNEKKKSSK